MISILQIVLPDDTLSLIHEQSFDYILAPRRGYLPILGLAVFVFSRALSEFYDFCYFTSSNYGYS